MKITSINFRSYLQSPCNKRCSDRVVNLVKENIGKKECTVLGIGAFSIYSFGILPAIGIGFAAYAIFRFAFSHSIKRAYPPLGSNDTFSGDASFHGKAIVFEDDEISCIYNPCRSELFTNTSNGFDENDKEIQIVSKLQVQYSKNNKAFFQQKGIRSCSSAVAAMLTMDHNKIPIISSLTANIRNNDYIMDRLSQAGLKPIQKKITSLKDLELEIRKNGSAIISIEDENISGHSIIVDAVFADKIRLRDPYHGWEIDVTKEAFEKRTFPKSREKTIIQAIE